MRRTAAAGAFIALLSGVAAADGSNAVPPPGVYQYPPVIRLYSWSGPYIGGHLGAGWNDIALSDSDGRFLGGVQAGFNVRAGRAVFGLEAQWTGSAGGGNDEDDGLVVLGNGVSGAFESDIDWLAALTARLGVTWDRSLLYVKGGAAWAQNTYRATLATQPGAIFEGDDTRFGWAIGVGYETAFRSAWSVRLEYLFMDFGSDAANLGGPAGRLAVTDIDQQVHAVTLGLNYRFDWPLAGPLGTPY